MTSQSTAFDRAALGAAGTAKPGRYPTDVPIACAVSIFDAGSYITSRVSPGPGRATSPILTGGVSLKCEKGTGVGENGSALRDADPETEAEADPASEVASACFL